MPLLRNQQKYIKPQQVALQQCGGVTTLSEHPKGGILRHQDIVQIISSQELHLVQLTVEDLI